MNEDFKKVLKIGLGVLGVIAIYKIVAKKKPISRAIEESADTILKPITVVVKEAEKIGEKIIDKVPAVEMKESNSQEKKSDKVTAGRKGGKKTAKLGKHKGHTTKKGLVQDQKKASKEKHEKHYRKSKRK